MSKVIIYKLQNDGSQSILATCTLVGDEVKIEGDEVFTKSLIEDGINDYSSDQPHKLFPKDGLAYLEQLKYNFKSGYLSATDVAE